MQSIKETIANIRQTKPVILNLTNVVTMDFVANCLLAVGAAPIMSVYEDELEALVNIASVIYINIGTLNDHFIQLVTKAITVAKQYQKPIVLDPVGCGATKIRTQIATKVVPHCQIVRGNASEIMALGNNAFLTKGVESVHKTEDAKEIATNIAKQTAKTVVVSGEEDYITDGLQSQHITFGSAMMAHITGMGCAVSAVIAAVLAIEARPFQAGTIGASYFSLCGSVASRQYQKPGSFKTAFIDALYDLDVNLLENL